MVDIAQALGGQGKEQVDGDEIEWKREGGTNPSCD